VIAAVAVFVVGFGLGFLLHGVLLADDYTAVQSIMRPKAEVDALMLWMTFGFVVWSFGLAWLYSKGLENKAWLAQGFRFGLGVAAITAVPANLTAYTMQPLPLDMALKGMGADAVIAIGASLAAAAVYHVMGEKKA
jgi:hypothetical protein